MISPGNYWQAISTRTAIYWTAVRREGGWTHVPGWIATTYPAQREHLAVSEAESAAGANVAISSHEYTLDDAPYLPAKVRAELGNPEDHLIVVIEVTEVS